MNAGELFRNYPLDMDSFSYSADSEYSQGYDSGYNSGYNRSNQYGGEGDAINNEPNGGFLPIYVCKVVDDAEILEQKNRDEKAKREYETHNTSVSIKSLLEARRKNTTFVKT